MRSFFPVSNLNKDRYEKRLVRVRQQRKAKNGVPDAVNGLDAADTKITVNTTEDVSPLPKPRIVSVAATFRLLDDPANRVT